MADRSDFGRSRWALPLSSLLGALSIASLVPAVPFYILDLGGSPLDLTLATATFSVGGFLFTVWAGFLGDRFGARVAALILMALAIPAGAILPFVSDVDALFPIRFLMAAAVGLEPIILATVAQRSEIPQSRAMAELSSAKAIGLSVGPLVAAAIALSVAPSHSFMWTAIAAQSFLIATLVIFVGGPRQSVSLQKRQDHRPGETWRELFKLSQMKLLLLMRFVMGASNGIALVIGALIAAQRFGWGVSEYGLLLGSQTVLLILLRTAVTARAILEFREREITIAALLLFGLSMLAAQAASWPSVFIIAYLLIACANAVLPVVTAVMSTRIGSARRRTSVMGWGSAVFYAGDLVFTLIGGLLFILDPRLPFIVVAAGMLSMAALYGVKATPRM